MVTPKLARPAPDACSTPALARLVPFDWMSMAPVPGRMLAHSTAAMFVAAAVAMAVLTSKPTSVSFSEPDPPIPVPRSTAFAPPAVLSTMP